MIYKRKRLRIRQIDRGIVQTKDHETFSFNSVKINMSFILDVICRKIIYTNNVFSIVSKRKRFE